MAEYIIGTITLFTGEYAPKDFHLCDGSTILIKENTALFSVIGSKFGGDGGYSFKLPNLDAPTGFKYIICVNGLYPVRDD